MAATPAQLTTSPAFGHWHAALQSHLSSKLATPEDAEDLAQEACVKFFQAHRKNRPIHNPRAYLFQIGQHLLYHHYAARARRPAVADIDIETLKSADATVEELALDAIRRQQINRAVAELSPKCRQALRLRWQEGRQIAEIAEAMALSRAMVKKYLAQGLAHCRKRLRRFKT